MQARIFVTDGQKTVKLFWLAHENGEVHCGLPRFAGNKLTYHESGEIHATQNGENINKDWRYPLSEIKGLMHLTTIQSVPFLFSASQSVQISSKKYDASLLIDLRSLSDHADLHIAVGLLEKDKLDAITPMLLPSTSLNNLRITAEQAFFITSVSPWVWVILYYWHREEHH